MAVTTDTPLVEADALRGFAGAPFDSAVVLAIGEGIRREARWHIAPTISETVVVEHAYGRHLFVPTLQLVAVEAIRRVVGDQLVDERDYLNVPTPAFRAGVVTRTSGWTPGVYELDVVHGYERIPAELLPAVVSRCQRARIDPSVGSVRLGGLSITPASVPNTAVAEAAQPDAVLAHFTLPGMP